MNQLVYRQERGEPFLLSNGIVDNFRFVHSVPGVVPLLAPLFHRLGLFGVIKTAMKLSTGKRKLYCVLIEGRVAHCGWASFSFCRYYAVRTGDVVIGLLQTDERFRGRGYATLALKRAINELVALGSRVFWIDTSEDNISCQKVIEKCGFGNPVSSFERPAGGL